MRPTISGLAALALTVAALVGATSPGLSLTKQEKLCKDGTPDQQVDVCTQLIEKGADAGSLGAYYNNRGFGWWDKNECDLAIADFSEAADIAKGAGRQLDQYNYMLRVGRAWEDCKDDPARAVAAFSEAISAGRDEYELGYYHRGNAYSALGEADKAIADFTEAIRREPKFAGAYLNRGNEWKTKGNLERALSDLNQAIRLDPKEPKSYANRGELWLLRGDLDKALADQNKAIQLGKDQFAVLYVFRGTTYRYRSEFDKAIADFNKASSLYDNYTAAFTGLGLTYEKMGDTERAKDQFRKAIDAGRKANSSIEPYKTPFETAKARLESYGIAAASVPAAGTAPAPTSGALASTTAAAVPEGTAPNPAPTPAVAPAPVIDPLLERRIALVIGNSVYRNVAALPNPSRDARAVAAELKQIGFDEVTIVTDTNREHLVEALRTFATNSENADWAMVYYAGHGIEVGGTNYLIPVDAKLAADRDAQYEAVPLDQVLGAVEGAKKLRLVMLDSCRDNPFVVGMRRTDASRSISRGFDRVEPNRGTLVVYAAKDGQVALDGDGGSSPFSAAFLKRIASPGIEINKLFRLVRDDVLEATSGRQEPFVYGSLPGSEDYYFTVAK